MWCGLVTNCVSLFAIPWIIAHQAPLSHGVSQARILEWVVFSSPGDLLLPGIVPRSPAFQVDSLPTKPPAKTLVFFSKHFGKLFDHVYNCPHT